jgi:hypothetical protein
MENCKSDGLRDSPEEGGTVDLAHFIGLDKGRPVEISRRPPEVYQTAVRRRAIEIRLFF